MITVKGLDRFASHAQHVSTVAGNRDRLMVETIARRAKTTLVAAANPKQLSRFNRGKGTKLGARYTPARGKPATSGLYPTPPGPWYLLEKGGKAHQIARRGRGRDRFLGRPGIFAATGPVSHPAVRGKATWSRSEAAALAASHAAFAGAFKKQYVDLFKG